MTKIIQLDLSSEVMRNNAMSMEELSRWIQYSLIGTTLINFSGLIFPSRPPMPSTNVFTNSISVCEQLRSNLLIVLMYEGKAME